jgi:hypothetical protein
MILVSDFHFSRNAYCEIDVTMVTVEIKECRNAYCEIDALELELESFYSITTFIRAMTSLLQIRQVAHLMEHHMQPARIKPHAWSYGAVY